MRKFSRARFVSSGIGKHYFNKESAMHVEGTRTSECTGSCLISEDSIDVQPGWLLTRVRAISARVNKNFDGFTSQELKTAYKTFEGKPVFVNHVNHDVKRARGRVALANYHEHGSDKFIECFMLVDGNSYPKLAQEILDDNLDSVSMGCDIVSSICSLSSCRNEAKNAFQFCDHVLNHKGKKIGGELVYEECVGLSFFELSYVFDPADETAVMQEVRVASNEDENIFLSEDLLDTNPLSVSSGRSIVALAVDDVTSPKEVDTLRTEEMCPECGADDFDGEECDECGHVPPIEELDEPDVNATEKPEVVEEVEMDEKLKEALLARREAKKASVSQWQVFDLIENELLLFRGDIHDVERTLVDLFGNHPADEHYSVRAYRDIIEGLKTGQPIHAEEEYLGVKLLPIHSKTSNEYEKAFWVGYNSNENTTPEDVFAELGIDINDPRTDLTKVEEIIDAFEAGYLTKGKNKMSRHAFSNWGKKSYSNKFMWQERNYDGMETYSLDEEIALGNQILVADVLGDDVYGWHASVSGDLMSSGEYFWESSATNPFKTKEEAFRAAEEKISDLISNSRGSSANRKNKMSRRAFPNLGKKSYDAWAPSAPWYVDGMGNSHSVNKDGLKGNVTPDGSGTWYASVWDPSDNAGPMILNETAGSIREAVKLVESVLGMERYIHGLSSVRTASQDLFNDMAQLTNWHFNDGALGDAMYDFFSPTDDGGDFYAEIVSTEWGWQADAFIDGNIVAESRGSHQDERDAVLDLISEMKKSPYF